MNQFVTKRFGPISTGQRCWRAAAEATWVRGYGRIVEITFLDEHDSSGANILNTETLDMIDQWLNAQWNNRILIAHDDPLLPEFQSLHELGGCNINIMQPKYGPGIESACEFVYDGVDNIIFNERGRTDRVKQVQVWEHEGNSSTYDTFPPQ